MAFATATTTTTGQFLTADQAVFTDQQWAASFDYELGDDPEDYAASVLAAAWDRSESLILTDHQMDRLLGDHGFATADLKADATLDHNHAGQALVWLGY
jgi:hypothetical protein